MKNEIKSRIEKIGPPLMTLTGMGLTVLGAIEIVTNLVSMSADWIKQAADPNTLMVIIGAILGMTGAILMDRAGGVRKI